MKIRCQGDWNKDVVLNVAVDETFISFFGIFVGWFCKYT